jgi:predicted kinase
MIILESINDKYLFKSCFMAGGGGSGKGFVLQSSFGLNDSGGDTPFGAKVVNSDILFEFFLEKNDLPFELLQSNPDVYEKQMAIRNIAKKLTDNKMEGYVNGLLPLLIDGTGRDYDKIKRQKEKLELLGYDTSMVFVNTSLEVALARNLKRKRTVEPEIIKKMWYSVQENIGKFQRLFGQDSFIIIDNSKDLNAEETKQKAQSLFKTGQKLLSKPLRNEHGRYVIKTLKAIGGKYYSDLGKPTEDKSFL